MNNCIVRKVSIVLLLCIIMSIMPTGVLATIPSIIYLQPNDNWANDDARFAACFCGNGETWVSMTDSDTDGIYEAEVPAGYSNVYFCRMNPNAADNNWNNRWNQTDKLTIPTNGSNLCVINAGWWDCAWNVNWVTYTPRDEVPEGIVPPQDYNYYIAGSFNNWDVCNDEYVMFPNGDGTYAVTIYLDEGSYEYKITTGDWNDTFPLFGTALVTVNTGCRVTFILNPADGSYSTRFEDTDISAVNVKGTIPSLDLDAESTAGAMMLVDGIYTITIPAVPVSEVGAPAYTFKVLVNNSWDNAYPTLGWNFYLNDTCDVTITFNPADNSVSITADNLTYSNPSGNNQYSWTRINPNNIRENDIVAITMSKENELWALYNGDGASSGPRAFAVNANGNLMTSEDADSISWNIVSDENGMVICKEGTEDFLYTTNSNNGVRVGSGSNKYWVIDLASGYLKNTATKRYLGVYNSQNWRAYTSSTSTNIEGQTLTFWRLSCGDCENCYENGICLMCGRHEPAVMKNGVHEISNAGQLYWFAEQVNGGNTSINGKLMVDIVVNQNVLTADGKLNVNGSNLRAWTPIGNNNSSMKYAGTFDGNGKTISGLYLNSSSMDYVGLFGYIGSNGVVKNVGITDSFFQCGDYVGGVVGYNNYGTINSCYNTGVIRGSSNVGGVVGYNYSGTINSCYNTSIVRGSSNVGGVVGYKNGSSTFNNCFYLSGSVTNGNNYGTAVTARQLASGEVAYLLGMPFGQTIGVDAYPTYGGAQVYLVISCGGYGIGYSNDENAELDHDYVSVIHEPDCEERGYTSHSCSRCGDTYNDTWLDALGHPELIDGFCTLCHGYEEAICKDDVYEIYNAGQLYWFAREVNSGNTSINGKLMANIVINENVLDSQGKLNGNGSNYRMWTPIGNGDNAYIGTFDGNNMSISGLYFSNSTGYLGLFGKVGSGGFVGNLGLLDSFIKCESKGRYIGSIVAYNEGTVDGCYNTGPITGYEMGYIGGIVGANYGTVSNCYNTGDVSGYGKYWTHVGGVAGGNVGTNSRIVNCYNTGYIYGGSSAEAASAYPQSYVGGVVGLNYEEVSCCYNTGDVRGYARDNSSYSYVDYEYSYTGGVVGCSTGYVNNCYNTGSVSAEADEELYIGGVVGYIIGETVENSYNLGNVTGNSVEAAGGVVGRNQDGSLINCYNGGNINCGDYDDNIGGIVGENFADVRNVTIRNCYNIGSVYGDIRVGGIVGYSYVDEGSVIISNCYNTGSVNGDSNTGGVVGRNDDGVVENCYYRSGCAMDGSSKVQFGIGCNTQGDFLRDVVGATQGKNNASFASGEVAYLLQGEQTEQIWGQKLGVDPSPVFSADKVYFSAGEYTNVPAGVTISGTLTTYLEDGDVTIELMRNGEIVYSTVVNGKVFDYAIEGVAAGTYTLRVSKADHVTLECEIIVGEEDATLDAEICPVGDVTGDGAVNIKDFQRLLRHVNKTTPLEGYALVCGDVTGDGVCNIKDFQRLLRHVNKTNPLF